MTKSYESGLIKNKNFSYLVVAFDDKIVKNTDELVKENFIGACDVWVTAISESEAINQAKLLVKRRNYEVRTVNERI